MPTSFSADEVLEMALQIERNGERFYREAAGRADDAQLKDLLLELAEMEADHTRVFADLKAKLPSEAAPEIPYDPYDEVALYLRAAADTQIFNVYGAQPESLRAQRSPEEVLRTAIQLEKDSVVFYVGIREIVPERLGKAEVDKVIKEEMSHIRLLSDQLAALAS